MIVAETVVTGGAVLRPGWVEVSAGLIVGAGCGPAPRPVDVDLGAATVVPGFVDMHVHGGGGGAFPEATPQSVAAAVELHRRHGTTRMVASLVSAPPERLREQVAVLAEQVAEGVVVGLHLEGPWLSPRRRGAHHPSALRRPDRSEIDALLAAGRGTIRMATLAPELPFAVDAISQLVDAGVVAAIGHTDASYEQTRAGVAAGATVATHLFNTMRPVHHREPGPVLALLENDAVTVELINDGTHLHPALCRQVATRAAPGRVALVTDAMAAAGMPDGDYRLGPLAVQVLHGVARVAGTDTIAGSTATMDQVFRRAVEGLHVSGLGRDQALLAAVQQSSTTPATALGLPAPGLTVGAVADLVVLNAELVVTGVLGQGRWVQR
jgi:N-acetylglucosamine-6-phosphate deacetylase